MNACRTGRQQAPALAYELARARILLRDLEPIVLLRQRDERAIAALGPYALDLVALVGKSL